MILIPLLCFTCTNISQTSTTVSWIWVQGGDLSLRKGKSCPLTKFKCKWESNQNLCSNSVDPSSHLQKKERKFTNSQTQKESKNRVYTGIMILLFLVLFFLKKVFLSFLRKKLQKCKEAINSLSKEAKETRIWKQFWF